MDTKILEQIEELFSQELALVQHDFKALGKMLKEKCNFWVKAFYNA